MSVFPLPCIICNTELEAVQPGDENSNQAYSGLSFSSSGHYGSQFDPMRGNVDLVVTICDDCLIEKRSQNAVAFRQVISQPVITSVKLWETSDGDG